jgi:hypothetical protein
MTSGIVVSGSTTKRKSGIIFVEARIRDNVDLSPDEVEVFG